VIDGEAYTSPEGPVFYLAALSGVRPTKKANRHAIRLVFPGRRTYFFSGGWLNGKVPNMFLAWLCICSCICTNRFLLCSM